MAAPQPRPLSRSYHLADEAATAALGRALAGLAQAGDVIALTGDLGTGKTTFARAFINALPSPDGGPAHEEVPSPTFTLLQVYERAPAPVWHFDVYRLGRPEEVHELGLEEALSDGITLIEWAERLGRFLPAERLDVHLSFGPSPNERRARLSAGGRWRGRLSRLEP